MVTGIRTVQKLSGHRDVSATWSTPTTSVTMPVAASPLDAT
jgi:hypothetical protein